MADDAKRLNFLHPDSVPMPRRNFHSSTSHMTMCSTTLDPSMLVKAGSTRRKTPEVDSCWHVAALGFLTSFLVSATMSNSGFFYVGFMEEFNVNRESATWPRSVASGLCLLSGFLVAPLQRKVSLFTIFLMGGLFAWAGVVASAFVPNMAWMSVTLGVINGLGVGITTMTYSILLAMYFEKYRGITSGMKYAGASCAGLVFPKLLAHLQEKYGFRGTLLICGGIIMHVSAIGIFVKEPPWTCLKSIEEDAKNTTKERSFEIQNIAPNTQELHGASKTVPREQVKKRRPALALLANPMLYIIITMAVVADFTGAAYVSTIVDYGVDKGLSIDDAESLIIYGSCSEIVGRLFLPLLADKGCIRRTTLVMATLFIWGCSMMLFPHSSLHVHIILVCLCAYLSFGCLQSMRSVLMADYIGVQWISICYGLSGLVLVPLTFCSPSITGFFRDSRGSYDGLYRFHGGVQLVVSALFLAVVFVERKHASLWTLNRSTQK